MRHLAIALLALTRLPASVFAQEMPSAPAPAPDPAWSRLQNLQNGQPIVVTAVDNRSVHCLFAGVTVAYLFCDPPGNPQGVGFRFDHAEVLSVDLDWTGQTPARATRAERNYHPVWIGSMIAGGIIVGFIASQRTDAGKATQDGAIGAAIIGLIGAPAAFLPHPMPTVARPVYPQFGIGLPVRFKALQNIRDIPILLAVRQKGQ